LAGVGNLDYSFGAEDVKENVEKRGQEWEHRGGDESEKWKQQRRLIENTSIVRREPMSVQEKPFL